MKREAGGPCLSVVFVDYDNIYLSLKRKSEEAAKRFAREAGRWLREIESGGLITPTNAPFGSAPRRIVMNRCYGNPVPRRNPHDNSTDMSSFPFVRHHFLRAGFEVIDCPPLTAQLKNSADIRMVMDIRDLLLHDTYFDEFIILSGDADFTPVLIRLRAHARRTVVFANDFTAAPYTAICDGEVREAALIELILAGEAGEGAREETGGATAAKGRIEEARREILAEVIAGVRASTSPVPLEALADRALRALGHERTIATGWAGAGSFRELLRRSLPDEIKLTGDPPYLAFDPKRHQQEERSPRKATGPSDAVAEPSPAPSHAALQRTQARGPEETSAQTGIGTPAGRAASFAAAPIAATRSTDADVEPAAPPPASLSRVSVLPQAPPVQPGVGAAPQRLDPPNPIQQSIARIQEACQAPPLAPQEYRVLFEIMAKEISEHDLLGVETLSKITQQVQERGIDLGRDDVRFVLEVVSEVDPWFEQGASADLFASRFRTFVVARCRGQGLNLSADELHLIDAWFLGPGAAQRAGRGAIRPTPAIAAPQGAPPAPQAQAAEGRDGGRWAPDDGRDGHSADQPEEPRVVRTRMHG
jgi:NYN domain-containing protein